MNPWEHDNPLVSVDGYRSAFLRPPINSIFGPFIAQQNIAAPYGYGVYYEQEKTWNPPTPYVSGQPEIPYSRAQVMLLKNEGWNTWARSIAAFVKGKYYTFNCSTGIKGCCLGIGPSARLGAQTNAFTHSIIVSNDGVLVHESGTEVAELRSAATAETEIRMFRQSDGAIVYCAITGQEVRVYTSLAPYPFPEAYIFGYIYSSDDKILTSAYTAGQVHYGAA